MPGGRRDMTKGELRRIEETVNGTRLFSSHEHFFDLGAEEKIDVNTLIANSYLDAEWTFHTPGRGGKSRASFLSHLRAKSYLHWFRLSLRILYGMDEPLSEYNWDEYGTRINEVRGMDGFPERVYRDHCLYDAVVQDAYWDPGSIPDMHGLFHGTFRINSFLYSYRADSEDHNGNNARRLFGFDTSDIDEYLHIMEQIILKKRLEGCVALKSALAYDRAIAFRSVDKLVAERILRMEKRPSEEEVLDFGDFIFHRICRIAEEQAIPFQIHTGLGLLWGSHPMNFEPIIRAYPGVRFVLFHGGYPWYQTIGGLLHNYPNVHADLVWLPLISPTAAIGALHEWLEVSNSIHRIAWGSDCKTPEESYGASLAFRSVLNTVLAQKVESGYLEVEDALQVARLIAADNARALYLGEEVP
jgi:hypothetical protein